MTHMIRRGFARRQVLGGFAAFAAFAPSAFANSGPRISELLDGSGKASSIARGLAGTAIRLRGYLSTDATDQAILTESPVGVCQLCGVVHDPDIALRVQAREGGIAVSNLQLVDISGRVEISGDGVRLADAQIDVG